MQEFILRRTAHLAIGVVIAALVLHTWAALGLIAPVAVSGSSMAPALVGPQQMYGCNDCGLAFAVGLDQLPPGKLAVCPDCGQRKGAAIDGAVRNGDRLVVDRTAFLWRGPRRWEPIVFRCPERSGELCVKRVVGLPNETVELAGGDIFVDGRIVRKSLAEQREVRQRVDDPTSGEDAVRLAEVSVIAPPTWRGRGPGRIEYRPARGGWITDEFALNQGPTPPVHRVDDVMLTFDAQLDGAGEMTVAVAVGDAGWQVSIDFAGREVLLRQGERIVASRGLPPSILEAKMMAPWTLSLFDRQVLVANGDAVVLAESLPRERAPTPVDAAEPAFSIHIRGLRGQIHSLAVWRDPYYAVRHGDGRQRGARRQVAAAGTSAEWRLGPDEYFVVGDNAAISDDSRSWLSGPGIDAKLLIGKPLGIR